MSLDRSNSRSFSGLARFRTAAVALTLGTGVLFGTSGCNNAVEGGFSGAALGALVGMGIGSISGDMGKGAAIGALGGALGGAVLGDQNARSGRSY
jgi:hypothetical protein